MKFKWFILSAVALVFAALPALAQDIATQTVNFNGIGFQFDSSLATNVNIRQFAGDPTDLEQPGGPEVAHTEFVLYSGLETPPSTFEGSGAIRVYNTGNFAGYEFPTAELESLQALLAGRPDLALNMVAVEDNSADLPFMPVFPAAQVIRGQAHYIDTPALAGVAYMTVYRQDVSPFVASEFWYTFQGLSADGATYVSAVFPVVANSFPAEIPADFDYDTLSADYLGYMTDSIALLNSAAPGDFAPDITTIDAMIQTITLPGAAAPQPTPVAEVPTEAAPGETPSLGALAGTWRLVQYGDPNAPTAVIEGSEITLTLEASGLSGNGGCNGYGGAFTFDGNTMTVDGVVSTLMACADDAITAQEAAYFAALNSVTSFQVDGATLQLAYPEGVLVFQAVTPAGEVTLVPLPTGPAPTEDMSGQNPSLGGLAGTWRLVQYGDPNAPTAVIEGSEVTITFETSGLSGNGGCNTYGGGFVFSGTTITVDGVASTRMACVDDALTAQETAYLAALDSVTSFQVGDATLQLVYPAGVLVFQAV